MVCVQCQWTLCQTKIWYAFNVSNFFWEVVRQKQKPLTSVNWFLQSTKLATVWTTAKTCIWNDFNSCVSLPLKCLLSRRKCWSRKWNNLTIQHSKSLDDDDGPEDKNWVGPNCFILVCHDVQGYWFLYIWASIHSRNYIQFSRPCWVWYHPCGVHLGEQS